MLNKRAIGIMSIAMNVMLTNVSLLHRTLLNGCMVMGADHLFVSFFHEKYLLAVYKYIMVIPDRLHCVQEKHLMRNLKINELGPYKKSLVPRIVGPHCL